MPRALILVAEGFNDRDVLDVATRLHAHGYETRFVAPERGVTYKGAGGRTVVSDLGYLNVNVGAYELAVVPSGAAAEALTAHKSMYNIIYSMLHKGRAAGAIGNGIKVFVAANSIKQSPNPVETGTKILRGAILSGRQVAAPEDLKEELEKAEVVWVERHLATDGPVVTTVDAEGDALARFVDALVSRAQQLAYTPHELA